MLVVQNIFKKFNKIDAVKDVSFEIKDQEIFSLIGPNGSGKTTIIKMIAGLINIDQGVIKVGGCNVQEEPLKTKAQIGYIPDDPTVWSAMTGEEFLHFSGALYGVDEKTRNQEIPRLLDIFKLTGIENNYFEDYSRGNKQKFTILAALLHKPKLLLIDEPIVGLDPVSAEIAQEQFKKFTSDGGSILLVTHTLSVAQEISDRIGVLKEGELLQVGAYNELKQKAGLDEKVDLTAIYKSLTK